VLTLACRGCCCGTSKHPDVDHDAHLDALHAVSPNLEITPCLGPCRWSNVVVAIEDDGTQHWFAKILSDHDIGAVTRWLADPTGARPSHLEQTPPRPDQDRAAQVATLARARLRHPLGQAAR
jgi:hypothetical protein